MSVPASLLRRLANGRQRLSRRIDHRFRQARPGSVLILVVALLVLMALMGTAYISTTRVDRHSSAQNAFNTEIDLLIDAVCKIEQQQILADAATPTGPPATAPSASPVTWTSPWTAASAAGSSIISARVPSADASGNNAYWPYLKVAPLGATFESPYVPAGQTAPFTYQNNTNMQPTSITVSTSTGSVIYPALTTDGTPAHTYLAGSASGSGIADAGFWRLPIGELNGVTYYGCAYSLDNGSAVNASIAYEPASTLTTAPLIPGDFFPTSVDLKGMLRNPSANSADTQMTALNQYRWNSAAPTANPIPLYDFTGTAAVPSYTFSSDLEAMWMQLGRRLDNPGLNASSAFPYQALPIGESLAMAHRYCLMNPAASPSILEQCLGLSVNFTASGAPIRSSPYSADQVQQWFSDNFNYDAGGNIRPLLVARNQTSSISGSRFTYRTVTGSQSNAWDSSVAYTFGDWVTGYGGRSYVCIQDTTGGVQPNPNDTITPAYWAEEPWTDYPVKTSINTGTFDQLWAAYWGVMCETGSGDPASNSLEASLFRNPIRGAVSVTPSSTTAPSTAGGLTPSGGDDTANIQAAIDSSQPGDKISFAAGVYNISSTINFAPDRIYSGGGASSGIAALTPQETLRLRAAIAAMNSQQLRGNNTRILSRQIGLGGAVSSSGSSTTTNSGGATLAWATGNPHQNYIRLGSFAGGSTTEFSGFTITGCELYFSGSGVNVHDNTFTNIYRGIWVDGAHDSHFDNNTFTNVSQEGVFGYPGDNNTFDNNTFDNTWEPIHMIAINNTTDISNNIITHATRIGIELQNGMQHLTVSNNWMSDWLPNLDPNNGIDSHMGISCATGPQQSGSGWGQYGEHITISGNTLIQSGPDTAMDRWAKSAIEIMGDLDLNITGNYIWGWGNGVLNGATGSGVSSSANIYICDSEFSSDAMQWGAPTAVKSTADKFYAIGDPNAPAWPSEPSGPGASSSSSSSSTTQPSATSLHYRVTLYGTGQQAYITEVYANNDANAANGGIVAVVIYNPYDNAINIKNWQWAIVTRGSTQLVVKPLDPANTDLSAAPGLGTTIGAHKYVVFASQDQASLPKNLTVDPGATFVYLPLLATAMNQELILLRPRDVVNGYLGASSADPNNVYDEVKKTSDLVPVDSYDFAGLPLPTADNPHSAEWHYIRPSDQATHNWYFVYPYTYDRKVSDNTSPTAVTAASAQIPTSRLFATSVMPGATLTPAVLGAANAAPADPSFATKGFPIQINNTDFGGPKGTASSQYPFGQFARNGDILQTTYIGAYRIDIVSLNADGTVNNSVTPKTVEYNPVTMDSAFADDQIDSDNGAENVGRFCPIHPDDCTPAGLYDDFATKASATPSAYHFATRLFDFLTVAGPADDYMQNVGAENSPTTRQAIANVKPSVVNAYYNSSTTTEDNAPIDGLININTAPWRVLATLPLAANPADNVMLAKAIVQYRDGNTAAGVVGHGPFKSILELNGVPNFRTTLASTPLNGFNPFRPGNPLYTSTPSQKTDSGPIDGDLAPFTFPAADQVPGDFEKEFLAFNRISNLITVRSDSFTTYVLVQGWRNAGTAAPELVVQRRAAFISDRSGSIPTNKVLNVTNVPVN